MSREACYFQHIINEEILKKINTRIYLSLDSERKELKFLVHKRKQGVEKLSLAGYILKDHTNATSVKKDDIREIKRDS